MAFEIATTDTTAVKTQLVEPKEPPKPQEKEIKVVVGAHEWEKDNKNYRYSDATNIYDIMKEYSLDGDIYNRTDFDRNKKLATKDTLIFMGYEPAEIKKYNAAMKTYYENLDDFKQAQEAEKKATELRMENECAKAGIQRALMKGLGNKYTLTQNEETGEVTIVVNQDTNLGTIREELGLAEGALRINNKEQIEKMEEKGFLSNFRTTCDDRVATAGTELKIPGSKFAL